MDNNCLRVCWSTAFYRHVLQFRIPASLNFAECVQALAKGGYVVTVTEEVFQAPAKQRFKL